MPFFFSVLYACFLGVASHFLGEATPRKWFLHDRFPYASWKWEKNGLIYEKIGIRKWKDHAPDMSRVMRDMLPKRVPLGATSAQVYRLVKETCLAEAVHVCLCLCAPGLYFFWKNGVGVFLTVLYIAGNVPFIMIQRYNRPRLLALARRLEIREERKQDACLNSVG